MRRVPGRIPAIADDKVAAIVDATLRRKLRQRNALEHLPDGQDATSGFSYLLQKRAD